MLVCSLLCFIFMFSYLDLGFSMLCALYGLVLVILRDHLLAWLHPPLLWLIGCDHLRDASPWCWCAWYTSFSTLCDVVMLALLALCHPLAFFASLHFCMLAYKFMYESVQTYICPARHAHFIWQHVCLPPFGTFRQLVFLACFPSTCFFTCLLACFLCHCRYTCGAWTHGARVCLPRHKQKKARMQAKGTSPQRAMFNRLGGLASLSGYIFLPLS